MEPKLIIFDADGTLRRCTVPGQPCPNRDGEWELIPGVRERLAKLPEGTKFAIVSNQGGIGLGLMPEETANQMLLELADQAFGRGQVCIMMCPHAPKADCLCRKPSPLMLYNAMDLLQVRPGETLYVGDMKSDQEAAQRAGVRFEWAWDYFGWPEPADAPTRRPTVAQLEKILAGEEAERCGLVGPQPGYGQ